MLQEHDIEFCMGGTRSTDKQIEEEAPLMLKTYYSNVVSLNVSNDRREKDCDMSSLCKKQTGC